jgi:hypothetical protein
MNSQSVSSDSDVSVGINRYTNLKKIGSELVKKSQNVFILASHLTQNVHLHVCTLNVEANAIYEIIA